MRLNRIVNSALLPYILSNIKLLEVYYEKKILLLVVLSLLGISAFAGNLKKIEGFSTPESVISDGSFVYVSNVGAAPAPTVEDGDGFISKLTFEGEFVEKEFITGLNAPCGMAVIKNVLYVVDVDRIKGFDLESGEPVYELVIEGTRFLNDITLYKRGTVIVSASDKNNLYVVNIKKSSYSLLTFEGDITFPNGLFYNKSSKQLFIAGTGADSEVSGVFGYVGLKEKSPRFVQLTSRVGLYDGIHVTTDGSVYLTDWVAFEKKGLLQVYSISEQTFETIDMELIGGPGDFVIFEERNEVWIPSLLENSMYITSL